MKSRLIKKIKKTDWYKQGGCINVFYTWDGYKRAFEYYGGFNYFSGKINFGYFDKKKQKKIATKILKNQIKDINYVHKKLIKPWEKLVKKQFAFNSTITTKLLSELSDKQLIKLHKQFYEHRYKHWKLCVLIEAFDPWGDFFLNAHMQKKKLKIEANDLGILVGQGKLHFLQCEKLDRLKIAKKLKQGKAKPEDIPEHVKKYFWIHNSWAEVYYLDGAFFLKLIKQDIAKNTEKINRTIKWFEKFASYQKKKKAELYKKYKLDKESISFMSFFSALTDWRDDRKAVSMQTNYKADMFLKELSNRTGIRHYLLTFLSSREVKSISSVKRLRNKLAERSRGCIYYMHPKTVEWFTGDDAKEMRELLEKKITDAKEVTGVPACKGKVKGKVKIILTNADFEKMKEGDILVTPMTRPEHTPIMQKAAAIVTDEGGITCHAAIISRELKIPCIIGTQNATVALKDDDLVEVDANKGVVRKLK